MKNPTCLWMVLSNDWIVGAIGGCPGWTAGGTGVGGPA
jgi:hypothetical protein